MSWKIVLAFFLFALIGVSEAHAERRALLVGVSKYDSDRAPTLQGPPNDVALMHDVLAQAGFDKIDVLADGAPDSDGRPTLANIRARFDALEHDASLKRGDQVMIYLSGHGIQVPDLNGDETDGADEAFLPADFTIGPNAQGKDEVQGALIDDEIGAFLDTLRNKGINVWLIMDSCFSASGARGNQPGVVSRYLSSRDLGVDFAPTKAVLTDSAEASDNLQPGAGKLVAFYAAQAYEPAYEEPYGNDSDGKPHVDGRFTAALANKLMGAGSLSYRQLFDTVIDAMSGKGQTPFVDGDGLDDQVQSGAGVRQFLIHDGLTLEAGQLEGITEGTLVALYKTGSGGDADLVGQAQVISADATSAQLQPVAADCATSTGAELCPESDVGQQATAAHFGRILSVPANLTLALGHMQLMDGDDSDETYKTLASDLATASGLVKDGIKVTLEADNPDVLVAFKDHKIWFAWPDGFQTTGAPSGVSWSRDHAAEGMPASDLAALLQKIGKAVNVVRLANSLAGHSPAAQLVSISGELNRSLPGSLETADRVGADPTYSPIKECRAAAYQGDEELQHVSTTKQCDKVALSLDVTTGEKGVDVNIIHVDANFGIDVTFHRFDPPKGAGPETKVQLANAYDQYICSDCPGTGSAIDHFEGNETVIVMSAATASDAPPFNLKGLEQRTRGPGGGDPVAAAVLNLAYGGPLRMIPAAAVEATEPEVSMFHLTILPRQLALADAAPPPGDRGVHPEGPLNIFLRLQQVGKGDTAGKQPAPQQPAGK